MGASLLVAVRSAFVTAVNELEAFDGLDVMYAWKPTEDREFAFTTDARATHQPASMKSGRNFRNETGRFTFVIVTAVVGGSPEDAADRALVLGLAVEEYVADNKQGVGGAYTLLVDGDVELTEMVNDRASLAEYRIPIRYNARLT